MIAKELTLQEFLERYKKEMPAGSKDSSTRYTEDIHIDHLLRHIEPTIAVRSITTDVLQNYVMRRSEEDGRHGRRLSHITIRKEIGSLAAIWNKWALPLDLVTGPAPTKGLIYNKRKAKAPFQTFEQIKRQIKRGTFTAAQERDLWDCVFLTLPEIAEVLEQAHKMARVDWVYPMFVIAARTGARRSEILRSHLDDLDFSTKMFLIREKKKDRSKELTFRHVPLSGFLAEVMMSWQAARPGGRFTICEEADQPITVQMSNHHFRWALEDTKWSVLPGWHVFRHSFASNAAAKGVDQRIIDEWMGHQTEEMRRRYRHLFPHQQQAAMNLVFADAK
jgi:integrase